MLRLGELKVLEHVFSSILEDLLIHLKVGEFGLEFLYMLLHLLHECLRHLEVAVHLFVPLQELYYPLTQLVYLSLYIAALDFRITTKGSRYFLLFTDIFEESIAEAVVISGNLGFARCLERLLLLHVRSAAVHH